MQRRSYGLCTPAILNPVQAKGALTGGGKLSREGQTNASFTCSLFTFHDKRYTFINRSLVVIYDFLLIKNHTFLLTK
jgi:hypothetical protein